MSGTVEEPVARRGRWRLPVVVSALIIVGLAFWGAPRPRAMSDDGMRGPYGRFPQAVAAGASRPGDKVADIGVVSGRPAVAAGDTTGLLDPATGRIVAKQRWKDQTAVALNGELQVSLCEDKKANAICGFDPATGAELWRRPWSGHIPQLGESFAVADGRVYLGSVDSRNGTDVRGLVVFDGRTGKILGRIPLTDDGDYIGYIYGPVTDGVVAVGGGTAALYAERP